MNHHRYYTSLAGWEAMMGWYERRLSGFTIPIQSHIINTRYGCTHLITAGDTCAPPILLLHGTNVSALGWQAQIEGLARDYFVIAPDVIGYAGKSDPVRLSYRNSAYADWLADVLDEMRIAPAIVVGASGGGFFALKLAYHAPQYVRALILLNPCGITPFRFPLNIMRQPPVAYSVAFASRLVASRWMAYRLAKKNVAPNTSPSEENIHLAQLLLKHYIRHHPPGMLPSHQLQHITTPILLLVSQDEPFFAPYKLIKRANHLFSDIQAQIIDGAGHDIHVERPDFINQKIHQFITSLL
jgi:pimeloyl-ACP methyl ester carboxylesterase